MTALKPASDSNCDPETFMSAVVRLKTQRRQACRCLSVSLLACDKAADGGLYMQLPASNICKATMQLHVQGRAWYTTSDTSDRMWLNAEDDWLITPKPIWFRKYSGATTAAGRICIRNLRRPRTAP